MSESTDYRHWVDKYHNEIAELRSQLQAANDRIKVLEEALTYIANKSFPINKQGLSKVKFPDQIAREALEDK